MVKRDRTQGTNPQPEGALIGAVFQLAGPGEYDPIDEVLEHIQPEDFEDVRNQGGTEAQDLWWAIAELRKEGRETTAITVTDLLREQGKLRDAGARIPEYALRCEDSSLIFTYADMVMRNSHKRKRDAIYSAAVTDGLDDAAVSMQIEANNERLNRWERRCDGGDQADRPRRNVGRDLREIVGRERPALQWAVPGLFAPGLTIFGAPSKTGKTTLLTQVGLAVCFGNRKALGQIEVEHGEVLLLALEETQDRMDALVSQQLQGERVPAGFTLVTLEDGWDRLDAGGITHLERHMKEHPNTRLICIDTFEPVRPLSTGRQATQYQADYNALKPLHDWANMRKVAVVLVTHLRKMPGVDPFQEITGSVAMQAVPDNMVVMRRSQDGEFELHRLGRHLGRPEAWILKGDIETMLWRIDGVVEPYEIPPRRAAMFAAMEGSGAVSVPGALSPTEVGRLLGCLPGTARKALFQAMQQPNTPLRKTGSYKESKYYIDRGNAGNAGNDSNFGNDGNSSNLRYLSLPYEAIHEVTQEIEKKSGLNGHALPALPLLPVVPDVGEKEYSRHWSNTERIAWYKANGFNHVDAVKAVNAENAAR